MEAALWNLVGTNPLKIFDFDTFSNRWAMDVLKQLKPDCSVQIEKTPFGEIPNLEDSNSDEDLLFCWNGSTSGVMIPSLEWLIKERTGLTFCDATSAAYATPIPFEKLDVIAFSYQKGLGAEAGIGCLVLSPKAFKRLKSYTPSWPIPRLLRIKDGNEDVFNAKLLNTPPLLVLEEILYCHSLYDAGHAYATVIKNKAMLYKCIEKSPLFVPLIHDQQYQSSSTGIFIINDETYNSADSAIKKQKLSLIAKHLSDENVGYDFLNHAEQPPSFRLWLGPTMESSDIEKLFPWIEWAYHQTKI
jgi:phosphoserine aminotransferase